LEIYALEFKGQFRPSAICSVSATIGIDWSIPYRSPRAVTQLQSKKTVSGGAKLDWMKRPPSAI
jgi:hypothetical protein